MVENRQKISSAKFRIQWDIFQSFFTNVAYNIGRKRSRICIRNTRKVVENNVLFYSVVEVLKIPNNDPINIDLPLNALCILDWVSPLLSTSFSQQLLSSVVLSVLQSLLNFVVCMQIFRIDTRQLLLAEKSLRIKLTRGGRRRRQVS